MNIGFKEWALVCEAMARGEQSIFLRKGGIAEGRDGFRFKHEEFFLFPTLFHEQLAKTKLAANRELPAHEEGVIRIELFARVEWTSLVTDRAKLAALASFHILRETVISERFDYDETPGVNVAFARIHKLSGPWTFPDAPKFGGCRSWLNLPEMPPSLVLTPVISDDMHTLRSEEIRAIIG